MDILNWLIPTVATILCTIIPIMVKTVLERKKAVPKVITLEKVTRGNKQIIIHINESNIKDETESESFCLGILRFQNIGKNFCVEKILINNILFRQKEIIVSNEIVNLEINYINRKGDLTEFNIEDFSIIISNEFKKCFICNFSFHKEGLYYNFELTNISKIHKKP